MPRALRAARRPSRSSTRYLTSISRTRLPMLDVIERQAGALASPGQQLGIDFDPRSHTTRPPSSRVYQRRYRGKHEGEAADLRVLTADMVTDCDRGEIPALPRTRPGQLEDQGWIVLADEQQGARG